MASRGITCSLVAAALLVTGCTHSRVANGALIGAGAGAVVAGVVGGSVAAGAAVGAAGGAVVGAVRHHDDGYCYQRYDDGNERRVDCH